METEVAAIKERTEKISGTEGRPKGHRIHEKYVGNLVFTLCLLN